MKKGLKLGSVISNYGAIAVLTSDLIKKGLKHRIGLKMRDAFIVLTSDLMKKGLKRHTEVDGHGDEESG